MDAPRDSTFLFITAQDRPGAGRIDRECPCRPADRCFADDSGPRGGIPAIDRSGPGRHAGADRADAGTSRCPCRGAKRTAQQEAELQALEGRLANLRSTYATLLSFSSGSATNLLTVLEPATAPTSPVAPRILFNTLLAAALGMLLVVGVAFVAEQLDDRIKDPDAVQDMRVSAPWAPSRG